MKKKNERNDEHLCKVHSKTHVILSASTSYTHVLKLKSKLLLEIGRNRRNNLTPNFLLGVIHLSSPSGFLKQLSGMSASYLFAFTSDQKNFCQQQRRTFHLCLSYQLGISYKLFFEFTVSCGE